MANYLARDVVLVRFPFTDLTGTKVRPAVVVHAPHISQDCIVIPLTSKMANILPGEFLLDDWRGAGLNVPSVVKRGFFTIHQSLVVACVGKFQMNDAAMLANAVKFWLGL